MPGAAAVRENLRNGESDDRSMYLEVVFGPVYNKDGDSTSSICFPAVGTGQYTVNVVKQTADLLPFPSENLGAGDVKQSLLP